MSAKSSVSHLNLIGYGEAHTLPNLFRLRAARSPEAVAYTQFEGGDWITYTWGEVERLAGRWQGALAAEGLAAGDRVAVSLRNSVEWVCFDQAAQGLGLVVVPLYTTDSPNNAAYILADSGSRVLLIDSAEAWTRIAETGQALPELRRVLCASGESARNDGRARRLVDWLPAEPSRFQSIDRAPDTLATLVYTSGTTGRPKGVMLSHRNILWDAEAVLRRIPAEPSDVFLSFLPLAHAFERTVGYYLPMMAGCRVSYARSIEQLRQDLLSVRPTVLLSVPRVYDKIYLAIQSKLGERGLKRLLFDKAVAIGWRRYQASQGRGPAPGPLDRLIWPLLRHLVAEPVLERLGGRLRVSVSGGAPLSPPVARLFIGLGLPLTEGYGLTEAAPVVTGTPPADCVPGSVGRPLDGVETRIGPRGELLVRSPSLMMGYWNQPEATRQAIDPDGWLRTGDLAEIRDGRVFIRGRLKEILVTSTGEKVPPTDMELALTMDPLFDQACVLGEGRPYLAALLVLNTERWAGVATRIGLDPTDPASLQSPAALQAAMSRVRERLQPFPGYAQVRAIHLTLEPWTVDNGLITPTMKIKRRELAERFAATIHRLYRGHEVPRETG